MDTTLVGVVLNGLSHLQGARDKTEFSVCLIRGLGGNLSVKTRENFAKEVMLPTTTSLLPDCIILSMSKYTCVLPLCTCIVVVPSCESCLPSLD